MRCVVNMIWDDEADVWYTQSDDVPGLLLESPSFDRLIERAKLAAPEMLESNRGYTGPVELVFLTERLEAAV